MIEFFQDIKNNTLYILGSKRDRRNATNLPLYSVLHFSEEISRELIIRETIKNYISNSSNYIYSNLPDINFDDEFQLLMYDDIYIKKGADELNQRVNNYRSDIKLLCDYIFSESPSLYNELLYSIYDAHNSAEVREIFMDKYKELHTEYFLSFPDIVQNNHALWEEKVIDDVIDRVSETMGTELDQEEFLDLFVITFNDKESFKSLFDDN